MLPIVVPIGHTERARDATKVSLNLSALSSSEIRRAPDGWHTVLQLHGVEHRIWLKQEPFASASYVVELPFDDHFDARAHAARRLWLALNGRPAGPPFYELSAQRRQRLALALRALDARLDGATYRIIAEVLFGAERIPERAWKTHDLRNRTIRLVQTGLALMHGGYRELLRQTRRKR